jgi:hypothetical protein
MPYLEWLYLDHFTFVVHYPTPGRGPYLEWLYLEHFTFTVHYSDT